MKKNIIILSLLLAATALVIIGFTNTSKNKLTDTIASKTEVINPEVPMVTKVNKKTTQDLYYGIDTRFAAIKKSDIEKSSTLYDFLNASEKEQIAIVNTVDIIVIKNNQQSNIRAYGTSDQLTDAQLKLIKSRTYFEHFIIRTEFKEKNKDTGQLESHFFGPHITVVPDKQATYINGKDALITYLKTNSAPQVDVITNNKVGAIKISFIITKDGKVFNVKHDAMTTGYKSIDEKLIQLIKNIPGEWTPAENTKGEKIEQELVFTFGPKDGC
ncbi:hypothetical protein OAA67_04730 [Winogradskyella sp.]|nr:hypothetical protein [Winogradskyella sp.]